MSSSPEKPCPVLYDGKGSCCGCSACCCICPAGAIAMVPDEEGFLYPQVDETKCIRCELCLRVCAFKKDQSGGFAERSTE
ncbi:MAG: (Fe-S)-binding protein [Eubacteriales bacterium]|nr:(Fe-S)-binding protein [Eubacteriales bacterium]